MDEVNFYFTRRNVKNVGNVTNWGEKPTFYCHPGLVPGSVITASNEKKLTPAHYGRGDKSEKERHWILLLRT